MFSEKKGYLISDLNTTMGNLDTAMNNFNTAMAERSIYNNKVIVIDSEKKSNKPSECSNE